MSKHLVVISLGYAFLVCGALSAVCGVFEFVRTRDHRTASYAAATPMVAYILLLFIIYILEVV